MADDLPAPRRLDRAALDRVLARASELQSSSMDSGDGSALTEEEILDLGREAGMSPEHLRQAIAEERTRGVPPDEGGITAAIFGGSRVRASRVVPGRPGELLDAVDSWMRDAEGLGVKRRSGDRMLWEPQRGIIGNIRRALNVNGRGFALMRADEVAATVTRVDDTKSLVALDASLIEHRGGLRTFAGVMTGAGAAATAIAVVVGVMIPVAVIPAIALPAIGFGSSRRAQAQAIARAQLALEQLLDHLERGDHKRPGGLLGAAAAALLSPRR